MLALSYGPAGYKACHMMATATAAADLRSVKSYKLLPAFGRRKNIANRPARTTASYKAFCLDNTFKYTYTHDYYCIWFNFSAAFFISEKKNRSHKTKNPFYSSRTMS
jgi:hypothetical protein